MYTLKQHKKELLEKNKTLEVLYNKELLKFELSNMN